MVSFLSATRSHTNSFYISIFLTYVTLSLTFLSQHTHTITHAWKILLNLLETATETSFWCVSSLLKLPKDKEGALFIADHFHCNMRKKHRKCITEGLFEILNAISTNCGYAICYLKYKLNIWACFHLLSKKEVTWEDWSFFISQNISFSICNSAHIFFFCLNTPWRTNYETINTHL